MDKLLSIIYNVVKVVCFLGFAFIAIAVERSPLFVGLLFCIGTFYVVPIANIIFLCVMLIQAKDAGMTMWAFMHTPKFFWLWLMVVIPLGFIEQKILPRK